MTFGKRILTSFRRFPLMGKPQDSDINTLFQFFIQDFLKNRIAVAALFVLVAIISIALFAPLFSPQNPYDLTQLDFMDGRLPPGSKNSEGTMTFWLGSDDQGRDLLSGIFYGLRTSLFVGIVSAFIALLIGGAVGLLAAFFGRKTDTVLMRIVDIQLSFPAILIALILLAILGQGIDKIIIALVATQWAYYARAMRGSALAERGKEYMEAAQCAGLGNSRIIFNHLLPNCMPPLIVIVTMRVAYAVMLEATLSFLGIGLPITEPSLGLLISNGFEYILSGTYWISMFPGLALLILIVSINIVGDHLRDILNPRLQR
jgi:peptide/nickel transport system permease protein